jgi:hypothetical protein
MAEHILKCNQCGAFILYIPEYDEFHNLKDPPICANCEVEQIIVKSLKKRVIEG